MRRLLILLIFLLSGAAGLIYQVAWMRRLCLIFGVTSEAVATVLAVFMGGLALGSWLLGRAGDETREPLRFYGWLELGIALFGFQSVILLDGLKNLYVNLVRTGAVGPAYLPYVRCLLACALLIGPTTLMGGTLPVLIKGVCRTKERIARTSGLLYAVNTLGAVAGTLFCAFYLIRAAGIRNAVFTAASINLGVGIIALRLARRGAEAALPPAAVPADPAGASPGLRPDPPLPAPARRNGTVRAVVFAFGVSGFLALAYEVLWTRYLIYVVGENSVYAFSLMLAAFLLGIVLGSLIAAWLGDRIRDGVAFFGGVQVLIGAAAFGTVAVMGLLAQSRQWGSPDFWVDSGGRLLRCLAVLGLPCTLSGTTFAIVAKIYAQRMEDLGRDAGRAYAVNTVGAILGALAGGFIVLPYLKLKGGLVALGAVNVLVGLWILLRRRPEGRAKKTAFVTALFALAGLASVFFAKDVATLSLRYGEGEIVFYEDGPESSVAVTKNRTSGNLGLIVDGDGQAGTEVNTQIHLRLLGHLPALFHPRPKKVLCVGFGAGISAGCLSRHPVERVDIVELSRAVIRGSYLFEPFNHDPLHDPKVRLIHGDGRNFLLATENRYDVITSDPIDPDDAGVTSLFSREYYELVRDHLNEGGVACQWITTGYDPDEYKMLLRTFQHVFPTASLWYGDFTTVAVGIKGAPRASLEDLRKRFGHEAVRKSFEVIGISRPEDLLPLCLAGPDQLRAFTGDGPLNTDDRPLIEYLGPRYDSGPRAEDEQVWKPLLELRTPDMGGWVAHWSEEDQRAVAEPYRWMTWVLERALVRYESWDEELETEPEKDLAPDQEDRKFLEKTAKRDADRRRIVDLTWEILGHPVSRLYLILGGVGRHEPPDELEAEHRAAYESAIEKACRAWASGDYPSAREAFSRAAEIHPRDLRAPVMVAACADKEGQPLEALAHLLSMDLSKADRWSGVRFLSHDLFWLVLAHMEKLDPKAREEMGAKLLALTPADEDRPPPRPRAWGRKRSDRLPHPRPSEAEAGNVDAWRLWMRDASWDLEAEKGTFTWRKKKGENR